LFPFILFRVCIGAVRFSEGLAGVSSDGDRMHVHLNLLGWVSIALMGTIYLTLPMVTGKQIYSVRLANVGFWFYAVFEALVYISGMAMALTGIMQLGLALLIFTPLLGIGVWIFIANVVLSVIRK